MCLAWIDSRKLCQTRYELGAVVELHVLYVYLRHTTVATILVPVADLDLLRKCGKEKHTVMTKVCEEDAACQWAEHGSNSAMSSQPTVQIRIGDCTEQELMRKTYTNVIVC